jgi:hypothetical protein
MIITSFVEVKSLINYFSTLQLVQEHKKFCSVLSDNFEMVVLSIYL